MATNKKTVKSSAAKSKAVKPASSRASAKSAKTPAKSVVKKAVKAPAKKVVAKTSAKPAVKSKQVAAKKIANKPTSKVVSKAGKSIVKPAPKKPIKATVAASKTAVKSVSKAKSKPAVTPKTPAKKVSVTSSKPDPKVVAKKSAEVAKPATGKAASSSDQKIMTVKQTTDAAALAEIDTSGYILPGIKEPGRRGRKPRDFQPENEEIAALNVVERAELKAADKARARDRKAKEKQFLKDAFKGDVRIVFPVLTKSDT